MGKKAGYSFRKFINDVHLWLGIASGIVIFLVCFSGTILAFEHEIKDVFSSSINVEIQPEKASVEQLTAVLKASDYGFVTGITIPSDSNEPYEFSVKKDLKERRGSKVLVNPYTSEIHKVEKSSADNFLMVMFRLHRWLLLDMNVGRPIVGVATIIFLILSISGLVLWFPAKPKWKQIKQGFKIKTDANWKRINHDLHNTLGFYSCVFIFIMAITGLCWSFEGYREGLGNLIGAKVFDRGGFEYKAEKIEGTLVSIDEAIAKANEVLNYEGELSVSFPDKRNNFYRFSKVADANWSPVASDKLYMDGTGKVLNVEWFDDKPLNTQFASLIKPIHTGEIYGTFSKIIYFIACLIGTSLPVTGTIIWINKLKKKNKRKKAKPVLKKVA